MEEERYTKDELKASEKFKKKIDIIEALLLKDREYTLEEAEEIIDEFMKGSVQ